MRFSEHFNITRTDSDDWFDPHLTIDTKLFIDPLLLYIDTDPIWSGAHDELVEHFTTCFNLVARTTGPTSQSAESAKRLLTFPEPAELGLGYTVSSTRGSGAGARYAIQMSDGIAVALAAGLDHAEHIEEIGILNDGIGADRISDAVANVLKSRLIAYTQQIATRHGIATQSHRVRNAQCFPQQGRWLDRSVELPSNPVTGKPVLLVPMRFLNVLPILNADDWFDSSLNADLRRQLNVNVGERVRKRQIIEIARRHPQRVREWAREQTSRPDLASYDFADDPRGYTKWDSAGREYAAANPIQLGLPITNAESLRTLLEQVLANFRRFVEQERGWSLLWDSKGNAKREEAVQLLFLGVARDYLRLYDVELDREVELGRGPVDFKLSRGTSCRFLIEIKKDTNGQFWNGLDNQLPSYLESDNCPEGWFVAVRFSSARTSDRRFQQLAQRTARAAAAAGTRLNHFTIDARRPPSASNI